MSRPGPGAARDRGQASVLLAGLLVVGLAVAGLAVDGGRLFLARRELSAVADAAALAGAGAVDEEAWRESDGTVVRLDPAGARREVARVLAASPAARDARVEVDVDEARVSVLVARTVPTVLLGLVGRGRQEVGATATAAPAVR